VTLFQPNLRSLNKQNSDQLPLIAWRPTVDHFICTEKSINNFE